jgi:hypothetical protein
VSRPRLLTGGRVSVFLSPANTLRSSQQWSEDGVAVLARLTKVPTELVSRPPGVPSRIDKFSTFRFLSRSVQKDKRSFRVRNAPDAP